MWGVGILGTLRWKLAHELTPAAEAIALGFSVSVPRVSFSREGGDNLCFVTRIPHWKILEKASLCTSLSLEIPAEMG